MAEVTDEQLAGVIQREEARLLNTQREPAQDAARLSARQRARAVLLLHLDDSQKEALERRRAFQVIGQDGMTYEIGEGRQHNVWQMVADRRVAEFCITHPSMPDEDIMLAQKLLLETDSTEFKRIANMRRLIA